MAEELLITSLVENAVNIGKLRGELGLCFLLRYRGQKFLFDTGQTDLVIPNARQMGLELAELKAVILSHGHYDHTGGLATVLRSFPEVRVLLHPLAVEPKYTLQTDGTGRFIGMPAASVEAVRQAASVVWTREPVEVCPGMMVTGPIPRKYSYEDTGGRFFRDAACTEPDTMEDEQALFVDTRNGLVVVLGCGHQGVINTLDRVRQLSNGRPIHTVIGGLHLLSAREERVNQTIAAFREFGVQKLVPAHCTGWASTMKLWSALPNQCAACPVGTTIAF